MSEHEYFPAAPRDASSAKTPPVSTLSSWSLSPSNSSDASGATTGLIS